MIEVWTPRGIRAIQFSPDSLQSGLEKALVTNPQASEIEEATKGVVQFLIRLHAIPGVDGVALSRVNEPPALPTFYISVLAPLLRDSDDSAGIVRNVMAADAELVLKLNPVMPSGMRFYDSTKLGPDDFVSVLRDKSRKSPTEKLFRAIIFKRDD